MKGDKTIGLDGVIATLLALSHDKFTSSVQIGVKIGYSVSAVEGFVGKLKNRGMIIARKGPNGGYALKSPLDQMVVGDIIPLLTHRHRVTKIALKAIKDNNLKEMFEEMYLIN